MDVQSDSMAIGCQGQRNRPVQCTFRQLPAQWKDLLWMYRPAEVTVNVSRPALDS